MRKLFRRNGKKHKVTTVESVTKLTVESDPNTGKETHTLFDKQEDRIVSIAVDKTNEGMEKYIRTHVEKDLKEMQSTMTEWLRKYPNLRLLALPKDTKNITRYQLNKLKNFKIL